MAFAYDGKYLPRITSYDSAHRFWERAQHWRGQDDEHDARVLDSKRKKNVTIRKLRDNSIACRLHHTDVVTFHPDNTMTVKPWRSISTDEFFNRLVGSFNGVIAWFNSGLIRAGDKLYTAHDTLKLDCASGRLLSETPPFKIRTVNRKKANEVRKLYGYQDFATWIRMLAAMGEYPRGATGHWTPDTIVALLHDRTHWPDLLQARPTPSGRMVDVIRTLAQVREAMYIVHPEVYDVEVRPYLTSWKEVAQWKRS